MKHYPSLLLFTLYLLIKATGFWSKQEEKTKQNMQAPSKYCIYATANTCQQVFIDNLGMSCCEQFYAVFLVSGAHNFYHLTL